MNQVYSHWLSRMISMLLLLTLLVHTQPAAAATISVGCGDTRVAELIAAIEQANTTPVADTIELAANCVYTLTAVHNTTIGENGLPTITTPLTINGNGASIERSTAAETPAFRFFFMPAAGTLMLRQITLYNGKADLYSSGGAILNDDGTLTISESTLRSNTADNGGAIYNRAGEITIQQSSFSHNSASYGGAIQSDPSWSGTTNSAHLTVTHSIFSENTAQEEGGGIWSFDPITVTHTTFSHNSAVEDGGAIYSFNLRTIEHSTFRDNTADLGGALFISSNTDLPGLVTNSDFSQNRASVGGGIYNDYGNLTIQHSTLHDNIADHFGGAITNYDILNLHHSTISNNTAYTKGGGIYNNTGGNDTWLVTHSTISNNSAAYGGGIYNTGNDFGPANNRPMYNGEYDNDILIQQSTISGNTATQQGGGIWNGEFLSLEASTITANSASEGGGMWSDLILTFNQSILAANTATSGADITFVGLDIITHGHNLLGSNATVETFFPAGTLNSNGDYVGSAAAPLDPRLGPLANNGGPTLTHMPLVGSPAIDSGPITATFTTDQRGFTRIYGPRVDIGAVEVQAAVAYTEHIYLPLLRTPAPAQHARQP